MTGQNRMMFRNHLSTSQPHKNYQHLILYWNILFTPIKTQFTQCRNYFKLQVIIKLSFCEVMNSTNTKICLVLQACDSAGISNLSSSFKYVAKNSWPATLKIKHAMHWFNCTLTVSWNKPLVGSSGRVCEPNPTGYFIGSEESVVNVAVHVAA